MGTPGEIYGKYMVNKRCISVTSLKHFWHISVTIMSIIAYLLRFKQGHFKLDYNMLIEHCTFFIQTFPRACKNSFVFSGSCPATIFEGRTDSTTPVIIPEIKF